MTIGCTCGAYASVIPPSPCPVHTRQPFLAPSGVAPNGPLCPASLLKRIEALEARLREIDGTGEEIKAGLTD
jgi:hypothetical protein